MDKLAKAKSLLIHYFSIAIPDMDGDMHTEIEDIVDYIFDAAVTYSAERLKEHRVRSGKGRNE